MISVVILTHNSSDMLEDCLKSLSGFSDEIILIDSNSEDNTKEIGKKYKAKIVDHNLSSFSEQRNIGLEEARGDFIFYIDADERLTEEFKKEALAAVNSYDPNSKIAGFFIRRKTFYLGRDWHFTDKVQRLFYKKRLKKWFGTVHETPEVEGEFGHIKSPILHYTHRTLEQMVDKTNQWSDLEADLRLKANHPKMSWWRFPRVMTTEFVRAFIKEKGYRNGTEGMIESIYQGFSIFITYAKLWEMQNKK